VRKISYVILVHHARKGAAHDAPVKRRSDLPNFTPAATPILYLRRNNQQLQLGIQHRAAQETNRLLLALKTNPPVLAWRRSIRCLPLQLSNLLTCSASNRFSPSHNATHAKALRDFMRELLCRQRFK